MELESRHDIRIVCVETVDLLEEEAHLIMVAIATANQLLFHTAQIHPISSGGALGGFQCKGMPSVNVPLSFLT